MIFKLDSNLKWHHRSVRLNPCPDCLCSMLIARHGPFSRNLMYVKKAPMNLIRT